jgi:hypothetical protein
LQHGKRFCLRSLSCMQHEGRKRFCLRSLS